MFAIIKKKECSRSTAENIRACGLPYIIESSEESEPEAESEESELEKESIGDKNVQCPPHVRATGENQVEIVRRLLIKFLTAGSSLSLYLFT